VRILANIQSVQTQIQAANTAVNTHQEQLDHFEQHVESATHHAVQLQDLSDKSASFQSTLDELVTKVASLEAQAVLRASEVRNMQAMSTDHALLLAEHKKTQMDTIRVTQDHTDRIVEWEGLMQAQMAKWKAHDEWAKQAKVCQAQTHDSSSSATDAQPNLVIASIATPAPAPIAPPAAAPIAPAAIPST
jgi:chromosome segregation ATPase